MSPLIRRPFAAFLLMVTFAEGRRCSAQDSAAPTPSAPGSQVEAGPSAQAASAKPAAADSGASSAIPKAFPAERYAGLVSKSPFAIASAPPEPVAPVENFATNFVVTGISKQKTQEGQETFNVFIRSRDMATRLVLVGGRPSEEGISVVSVEEAPVAAKSVVVLRKGSETGRVEFDQAAVAASASPAAPASPGAVGVKPSASVARPSTKPSTIPRPGMPSGSVPRPGASQAGMPAPAASPNGLPTSQEPRRRVRPIPEPPP